MSNDPNRPHPDHTMAWQWAQEIEKDAHGIIERTRSEAVKTHAENILYAAEQAGKLLPYLAARLHSFADGLTDARERRILHTLADEVFSVPIQPFVRPDEDFEPKYFEYYLNWNASKIYIPVWPLYHMTGKDQDIVTIRDAMDEVDFSETTEIAIKHELEEYGAWDNEQLSREWFRNEAIVWIALSHESDRRRNLFLKGEPDE